MKDVNNAYIYRYRERERERKREMHCIHLVSFFVVLIQYPVLPTFESDDLRLLTAEIEQARHFLAQSRSFRELFGTTAKPHEKGESLMVLTGKEE